MYFFVDSADRSISAHGSMAAAAKAALKKLNVNIEPGADPVREAHQALGERGLLQNLSSAFEAIAASDDTAAQDLAGQYAAAVNAFFKK